MVRKFDADATAAFFNTTFSDDQLAEIMANPDRRLHHRDRIMLRHIMPLIGKPDMRILDFGAGQGRLLRELLSAGYDALGMEKNEGMLRVALSETREFGEGRAIQGDVENLPEYDDASFDLVILMGVFQYLEPGEYTRLLAEAHRLLRPGGYMVCTYQNALFDMFTFNKYTVDFIMNDLLAGEIPEASQAAVQASLEKLLTKPDMPPYSPGRARDNIYVRTTNPLTVADELSGHGFAMQRRWFYEFFGLPPLMSGDHPEIAADTAARYEVDDAEGWKGNFMANAFLILATRD